MDLEIEQLHKRFDTKQVLEGVSFHAQGGKALGLLGRNGAGKTTTIRIIMGVFPADQGRILLDGRPLDRRAVSIGYLPEEHGLYPKLPVGEQLVYLAKLRGMKARDAKPSVTRWLERLGMEEYLGKKLDTLSKGNQQKIQLAAALVTDPDLVILDEPFSGLDPVNALLLKDVVKELIAQGKVVLFSSHQMSYVEEFCDSIAILHQGRIALHGEIGQIKRSYDRSVLVLQAQDREAVRRFCLEQCGGLVATTRLHRGQLLVILRSPEGELPLMGALAAQGFDLDSFGVYEPSLGEIFVQYTGDAPEAKGEVPQ